MAKNRMVSTAFWSDNYVANLDPVEKLLFLYLLTNERSTLAGIYELPIKIMAVETGIDVFMVEKILGRFEDEEKIKYHDGWVAVKNFLKHHEHGSPTVQKGINDAIKSAPEWAREFVGKGIDTLSPSASALSSSSASVIQIREEDDSGEKEKKERTNLDGFQTFWELYPRHEDKANASAEWRKLSKDDREAVFADLPSRKTSKAWTKDGGEFVLLAKTYLKNRRWEDEIALPEKTMKF